MMIYESLLKWEYLRHSNWCRVYMNKSLLSVAHIRTFCPAYIFTATCAMLIWRIMCPYIIEVQTCPLLRASGQIEQHASHQYVCNVNVAYSFVNKIWIHSLETSGSRELEANPSSGSTDHCGAVVQITYCSSDLCWSAGGGLRTWIQSIHRSIWLMDFEDFQESRSVAEAPQKYSELLSNSLS